MPKVKWPRCTFYGACGKSKATTEIHHKFLGKRKVCQKCADYCKENDLLAK